MDSPDLIFSHFPELTEIQKKQFSQLGGLYADWNSRINVISRKDMDHFYERHVLHSLGIAKIIHFKPGTKILDVGTGGGFPGIPLAILFPECEFHLADSIGKKIKVVNAVAESLRLKNVAGHWSRAEELKDTYDFMISRAVTELPEFIRWVRGKFRQVSLNDLPNGILYLRGDGHEHYKNYELKSFFPGEFFQTKRVVFIPSSEL